MDQSVTISRGELKHTHPAPVHALSGKTGTESVHVLCSKIMIQVMK